MRILKSIFCCAIPLFAVIALFLKLNGVNHIAFDESYYKFCSTILQNSQIFTIKIPEIPPIPSIGSDVIDFLITFVNGLTSVFNVIILIANVIISLLSFILGLTKTIIDSIKDILVGGLAAI